MQPWLTTDRQTVYRHGRYLSVERHTVQLPDGRIIDDWAWLTMPDFVIVIAQDENDGWLCFRQTKYAVEGVTLAPVGGYLEPDEEPLSAAQRELLEETGHQAAAWHALGVYAVDANRGAGRAHLFLATGARPVEHDATSDDLEEQTLVTLSRAQVQAALHAGEFKALAWTAGVALALLHTG